MKNTILKFQAILVLGCLMANACGAKSTGNVATTANAPVSTETAAVSPDQKFSDDELDELLSPIALYPDPLLAQMVPAATFIDQLEEANKVLGGKSDDNLIANQSWRYFLQRLISCRHRQLSRPFTHEGRTYRSCASCGMRREFDLETWQSKGRYYQAGVGNGHTLH